VGLEEFKIGIVTRKVMGKTWTEQREDSRIIVGSFSVVVVVKR